VRTNNVGVIPAQDLIVFLQDILQFTVVLGLGLLHEPPERLHPLVVVPEAGEEAPEA
jgi:hypothetical protein